MTMDVHGEYKVPGGKLVVVDFDVEDGRIAGFRLAGDFFLEPDEALEADRRARSTGLPVESSAADIAGAVRAALPDGAVLLGFTPESVATAVRRAIGRAADWRDFEWELLHPPAVRPGGAPRARPGADRGGRRRAAQADPADLGVGRARGRDRQLPVAEATRWTSRTRRGSASTSCAASPAAARCSWRRAASSPTRSTHRGTSSRGMSFAESYAYLDDWVLQALRSLGIDATYQRAERHHLAARQDRRRRAEAPRRRARVLHHVTMSLRHGRREDGPGAAHRPREDERQGHRLRREAGRPAAQADRPAPRRDHRADGGDLHPPHRRRARGAAPRTSWRQAEELVRTKFSTGEWLEPRALRHAVRPPRLRRCRGPRCGLGHRSAPERAPARARPPRRRAPPSRRPRAPGRPPPAAPTCCAAAGPSGTS